MTSADDFIIQLIEEKGLVSSDVVETTRQKIQEETENDMIQRSVVDRLIEDGALDPGRVTQILAEEFGMPMVEPGKLKPEKGALEAVSKELVLRYKVFPLTLEGNVLQVAITDPLDVDTIDNLSHVLQLSVEPVVAARKDVEEAIRKFYVEETVESQLSELGEEIGEERSLKLGAELPGVDDDTVSEEDAPIIRLVYMVITEAIKRRASDIHMEPLERRFRVRYRIDGVLHEVENPPKRLQLAIISRLKIMAQISIAEKRIPQDGRIQVKLTDRELDLRVSSLPTEHGESIVMRILDKEGLKLGLPELGFLSDDQSTFEKIISLPDGIFLVTGPTGSGKTTTLYACLNYINRPDRKIITVEDPVEYQLSGINQVQVRAEIKMTFSAALRAMLRQAPNIIMIGEIRDAETGHIAINASLTGHMVFSTLHTNDAPSAVTRLIDIGVKPFLVSAALRATMAQRLVRRVCAKCRKEYKPTDRELRSLNLTDEEGVSGKFMRGEGCDSCSGTGFRGRMGIFEIFVLNEEVRTLIYENCSTQKLRAKGRELGMRSMREDGIRKVTSGMTTFEEVINVTIGDTY